MIFKFCAISMALSDRNNLGWISLRRLMTVTAKSSISELKHPLKRPTWTRIGTYNLEQLDKGSSVHVRLSFVEQSMTMST